MTTQKKPTPPRRWEIDDLIDLGRKGGVTYLKAIPVLILEEWLRQEQGSEVYVRTKALERRLVDCGLHRPFPKKGTSNIFGALGSIQKDRNLTNPPLMKSKARGGYWVNTEDYRDLLEEFRQYYCEKFSDDYQRLFSKGEPDWQILRNTSSAHPETSSGSKKSEPQDEIQSLVASLEKALRDRQHAIQELTAENQKLKANFAKLQTSSEQRSVFPYHKIIDDELRQDCMKLLEDSETYIDAIRRAGVVVEERLRMTIGGNGTEKLKEGIDLVDYALMPQSGQLVISDHPAEQDGVRMLFRGAVQFVRNPPAHKKVQYREIEAWQTINLIDYLLMLLKQTKPRKS
jgi:hypothetical protein